MNWRMLPPTDIRYQTRTVNGRTYRGTPGTIMAVPEGDARQLQANHWTFVTLSGPTSARPTGDLGAFSGAKFFDETIGAEIVHDGTSWRIASTGLAA